MKPKFKNIMNPVINVENNIRLGFDKEVFEIEDPTGVIYKFIKLLNGSNTIEDLVNLSGLTKEEVTDGIATLNSIGVIEDETAINGQLDQSEMERYRANLTFFSNFSDINVDKYSFQKKLKDSKVVVIGLGGASLTAASLAGLGIGNLVGIDFDTIELSNLNRQFLYTEENIGQLKSEETQKRLSQINSNIEIQTHNIKVTSANDILKVIEGSDVIINGIDSPGIIASRWVNAAAVYYNIPIIQGGISNTKLIWETMLPNEGCYDCFLINSLRKDSFFEYQLRALYSTRFEHTNPSIAPHVALLSGFISAEVVKLLSGYTQSMLPSTAHIYDTTEMQITKTDRWFKVSECPTCGKNHSGIEPVDLEELILIAKQGINA
ncbi:HesA/MoeB/ThiF family protein [Paenibacillus sp. TY11]|uniref:HesA/MoeB/ThiF family protein n=1 Tax=Paenibacillus sp. TY11 TaxID=3448633 RepID=UPI00403916F2